jgi:hypothetical protein
MGRSPSLLAWEFAFMLKSGFVEMMPASEYDMRFRPTIRISLIEEDIQQMLDDHVSLDRERIALWNKHASRWHRFWSVVLHFGRGRLDEEAWKIDRMRGRRVDLAKAIQTRQEELKTLSREKGYLDGFVRTKHGYLRLTRRGEQLLVALTELRDELGDMTIDEFQGRIQELRAEKDVQGDGGG